MTRPLRIAIVNEIWSAGATRCARDLEKHLAARHIVRYYPRAGKESVGPLLADLATFAPDVVHCHSYYGDLPYGFLATVSRLYPTCFTPHDPRPIGTMLTVCWECPHAATCFRCPLVGRRRSYTLLNPYFWQRLGKRIVHKRAARTLRLITSSLWLRQRLLATELCRFRIDHIPYGIDLAQFHRVPDARARLGLPSQSPVLFYAAHTGPGWYLNERKGLRFLASAFVEQIVPRFPQAILVVGGESLVPNHANVRPAGMLRQEELPTYYSAADVFVAPTLADNLPYTVLEAMGCGTPVVASRVGGVAEEVDEGVTGRLVPPGDSEALGRAVLALLESRDQREAMGQAGREKAERVFGMDPFIHRHEELYQELATSANRK